MRKSLALLPALFAVLLLASDQPKIPPMPMAVSSNATAVNRGGLEVYSLMGIGAKKTWDDVTNKVYILHLSGAKWSTGSSVPGVAGRLGAAAIGARGHIFLFGGYILDNQGGENTVGDVNAYLPDEKRWYRGEDIPVPVDRAVIGLNHDRYIYLVGGRSKNGPVNLVQVYDIETNTWSQGTPFPGSPVFGNAGGLADDAIVSIDGAKMDGAKIDGPKVDGAEKNGAPKNPAPTAAPFAASDECWLGRIDKKDPNKITWNKLPPHPGSARFGIVAGAGEKERRVSFSGGTTVPHNYKGLDFQGKLAEISPLTFDYDVKGNRWETLSEDSADARTDTGAILPTPIGPMILGGNLANGAATARAMIISKH